MIHVITQTPLEEKEQITKAEYIKREWRFALSVCERIQGIMLEFVGIYKTAEAIAHAERVSTHDRPVSRAVAEGQAGRA